MCRMAHCPPALAAAAGGEGDGAAGVNCCFAAGAAFEGEDPGPAVVAGFELHERLEVGGQGQRVFPQDVPELNTGAGLGELALRVGLGDLQCHRNAFHVHGGRAHGQAADCVAADELLEAAAADVHSEAISLRVLQVQAHELEIC